MSKSMAKKACQDGSVCGHRPVESPISPRPVSHTGAWDSSGGGTTWAGGYTFERTSVNFSGQSVVCRRRWPPLELWHALQPRICGALWIRLRLRV